MNWGGMLKVAMYIALGWFIGMGMTLWHTTK